MPERPSAWTNLGAVYGNMGEYEKAVEMYNMVLQYDPGNAMARQNIGFMRYNDQNYAEAVRYLEPLIEEYINDPGFVQILGLSYGYLERREEALSLYEQAIALDPDNLLNHMNLAVLYMQQREPDKAEPHYLRQPKCETHLFRLPGDAAMLQDGHRRRQILADLQAVEM